MCVSTNYRCLWTQRWACRLLSRDVATHCTLYHQPSTIWAKAWQLIYIGCMQFESARKMFESALVLLLYVSSWARVYIYKKTQREPSSHTEFNESTKRQCVAVWCRCSAAGHCTPNSQTHTHAHVDTNSTITQVQRNVSVTEVVSCVCVCFSTSHISSSWPKKQAAESAASQQCTCNYDTGSRFIGIARMRFYVFVYEHTYRVRFNLL